MKPEKLSLEEARSEHQEAVVKLLRRLSGPHLSKSAHDGNLETLLQNDLDYLCQTLKLSRAVLFIAAKTEFFDGLSLRTLANFLKDHDGGSKVECGATINIPRASELYRFLFQGQWVPMGKSLLKGGLSAGNITIADLSEFCGSDKSIKSVFFPITSGGAGGDLLGALLLEVNGAGREFSEAVLDIGQIVARLFESRLLDCIDNENRLERDKAKQSRKDSDLNADREIDFAHQDVVSEVSRQLGLERWMRQTICKLHTSLDRDYLLQTLVDSLGRAFRVTRCLVVRTDGPAHPMVTHEYEEPNLSPLGLGRTGQFPFSALSTFSQKSFSINDVSALLAAGDIGDDHGESLLDSGIRGIAGAPLAYQGSQYGVVLLIDGSPRTWTTEDLECVEMMVSQAAIALSHCLNHHQLKDQLFHMSLLSNLTQQLMSALEIAAKLPKGQTRAEEKGGQEGDAAASLSLREVEVLRLIASGYANKEIAQRLFLTESTVELHASRIRKKLKLKSRTALVKYACDNGVV